MPYHVPLACASGLLPDPLQSLEPSQTLPQESFSRWTYGQVSAPAGIQHNPFWLQVLHTDLSELGSLRTAPYLVMFVSSNFGGWLGDALITRQQYSVVAARRTVNSIGRFIWSYKAKAQINPSGKAAYCRALKQCNRKSEVSEWYLATIASYLRATAHKTCFCTACIGNLKPALHAKGRNPTQRKHRDQSCILRSFLLLSKPPPVQNHPRYSRYLSMYPMQPAPSIQ